MYLLTFLDYTNDDICSESGTDFNYLINFIHERVRGSKSKNYFYQIVDVKSRDVIMSVKTNLK